MHTSKRKITLVSSINQETVFEGWFTCIREAVEEAVREGVSLDGVDLTGANLACANLDDAQMTGARLRGANFTGASFGNTDVTDAVITRCQFSCTSLFTVMLHRAASFAQCVFHAADGQSHNMNAVPVVISGLPKDVVYLDEVVKIGRDFISKSDIRNAGWTHLKFLYGEDVAGFLYGATRQKTAQNV